MMRCIFSKPKAMLACFASALLLAGCASNKISYMGISFTDTQASSSHIAAQKRAYSIKTLEALQDGQLQISQINSLVQSSLGALARRASTGDKHAQLELGIRFEEGRGVDRDLKKARKLYGKAASDSGGTTQVYLPPVDRVPGRLYPVYKGPLRKGLTEAKKRLIALKGEAHE